MAVQKKQRKIQNSVVRTYVRDCLAVEVAEVEVCLVAGIPSFCMVGLPEKAVKESRERVKAAIMNSGFVFPVKKITVNLSPADVPKSGGYFDLPIALAILIASGQVQTNQRLEQWIWAGELSLLGRLVSRDTLVFAIWAYRNNNVIVLPKGISLPEQLKSGKIHQVSTLACAVELAKRQEHIEVPEESQCHLEPDDGEDDGCFQQVTGRLWEKISMVIAAVGRHHLMMQGPPGVGKTLLAQSFVSILPRLSLSEMLDVALVYSCIGQERISYSVPIRSPHHHITPSGLLGGGVPFMPGEISLSQHGVLFLDEITELKKGLLDQLRQALAQGEVQIARALQKTIVKTNFQLIVAMNPCPCGYSGQSDRCICGHLEIQRYQKNISGPFLDRIDMGIWLSEDEELRPRGFEKAMDCLLRFWECMADSKVLQKRIGQLRVVQIERQQCLNAELGWSACQTIAEKARQASVDFAALEKSSNLRGRGWQKAVRVSQTIADCVDSTVVLPWHFNLAVYFSQHRCVN